MTAAHRSLFEADADDSALVRRVAAGDRQALSILVDRHERSLHRYAVRLLADPAAAEDVVQEAWLRLWARADQYDSSAARLSTWMHSIVRNLCIDSLRRSSRLVCSDAVDETASLQDSPELQHQSRELGTDLRAALAELPDRQRDALLFCHLQGLSNRDAAGVLDVSVEALESLLARGRRQMRSRFDAELALAR